MISRRSILRSSLLAPLVAWFRPATAAESAAPGSTLRLECDGVPPFAGGVRVFRSVGVPGHWGWQWEDVSHRCTWVEPLAGRAGMYEERAFRQHAFVQASDGTGALAFAIHEGGVFRAELREDAGEEQRAWWAEHVGDGLALETPVVAA